MSEFRGENAGVSERGKRSPKVAKGDKPLKKPPAFPKARGRQAPHEKRDPELTGLVKDFRTGIAQLGQATDRLARQKVLERITPRKLVELRRSAPSVARILEREIKTITQLARAAPDIKHTATVTRVFRERAERVIEQRLPQLYASILKAEQMATKIAPAKVALPLKKGAPVEALVKAARAIRSGRLPFLPLETRKKAQMLIDRIFARPRALEAVRTSDGEQRRLIDRYSLIPLAVRHDIMREVWQRAPAAVQSPTLSKPVSPKLLRPADRQLLRTVNEVIRERISKNEKETVREQQAAPVPPTVPSHSTPRTAQALPAFATQGAAAGGDYMAHTGENLHVISRNDRPLVEPHERGAATAPITPPTATPTAATTARARAPTARGAPAPPAPSAAASTLRPPAARPAQRGAEAATGQLQTAAGGTPMKIEGTLSIPGLSDWVAEIEGRTKQ